MERGSKVAVAASGNQRRRRTKLVKVDEGTINRLLSRPNKREGCRCDACSPGPTLVDALAELLDDPDEVEMWRAEHAASVALSDKIHDMDADILEQYNQKGYAMIEVEEE